MKLKTALLPLLALLAVGCVHHRTVTTKHPHGMPPGQAKKISHVHLEGCGHVLVGGTWVASTGVKARRSRCGGHR